MRRRWWIYLGLAIPLLPWFFQAGSYLLPRIGYFTDLLVSHVPNAIYLVNAIKSQGAIPLWSESIMSGYPFGEDPLSGLWYPPGWLAYLTPLQAGFYITVLLHLYWGGLGMFKVLEKLGLRSMAAFTGGVAFLLMPKLFAHFAGGHMTLIYAVAWTPWLLLAEESRFQANQSNSKRQWFLPGAVLGVIALADIRWLAYATLLWGFYGFFRARQRRQGTDRHDIARWIGGSSLNVIVCLGISAVLLLGLSQLTAFSTRSQMTPADVLTYSLPPQRLLSLLIPQFDGFAEWALYPGVVILSLAVYSLAARDTRQKTWLWTGVVVGSFLFSLGSYIPGMEYLASLPIFNLLRVPPRILFIGCMALIVLAAYGLDDLLGKDKLIGFDPVFYLAPVGGFVLFLGAGIFIFGKQIPWLYGWSLAGIGCTFVLIALKERGKIDGHWAGLIILGLVTIDLSMANFSQIQHLAWDAALGKDEKAALEYLSEQSGIFRIYSPSYSISQLGAAEYGLQMANGVDPLQISDYAEFLNVASGVDSQGYSVTVPYLLEENRQYNLGSIPDLNQLGLLNVRYVVSDYPLVLTGAKLVFQSGKTRVYENQEARPRAWMQPAGAAVGEQIWPVNDLSIDADHIIVQAQGPGRLVLSEVYYPGWTATIDDQPAEIMRVAKILRGIDIGKGNHTIELTYRPVQVYAGMAISVLSWIFILGSLAWWRNGQ